MRIPYEHLQTKSNRANMNAAAAAAVAVATTTISPVTHHHHNHKSSAEKIWKNEIQQIVIVCEPKEISKCVAQ